MKKSVLHICTSLQALILLAGLGLATTGLAQVGGSSATASTVGIGGTIFRTIDGGATWIAQPSATRSRLAPISFSGVKTGTATGAEGTTLQTINGGAARAVQSSEATKTPFAPQAGPTQLWAATYNGPGNSWDDAAGVAVSPNGLRVFVTGGSVEVGTGYDWATVAYSATTGTQLWVTRYNGPGNGNDTPQAAPVVSPDGSRVYVTGNVTMDDGTTQAIRTTAFDAATGSQLWATFYQAPSDVVTNNAPHALALSSDGSRLFVAGWSQYPSPIFRKYVTIAYDTSSGSQLWVAEYHGPGTGGEAYALVVSPDGSRVFVTGVNTGVGTHVDFATVAYAAANGAELWVTRYNGPGNYQDEGQAIGISADGSRVFVTGESASGPTVESFNYATVAYDTSSGSQLWVSRYNGPANDADWARKLAIAGNRVFVTGGSPGAAAPLQDFATVAYDTSNGQQLWVARYQGQDIQSDVYSITRAIGVNADGSHVFVTGPSPGIGTDSDYVTVGYRTSDGKQLWIARNDGPAHLSDTPTGLAVYGANVFVTGSRQVGPLNTDYATIAYQE
jgi:putative pyrroloquinoline-quinone binding quinoprotein